MTMTMPYGCALALALFTAIPAGAQTGHGDHGSPRGPAPAPAHSSAGHHHGHGSDAGSQQEPGSQAASTKAFREANARMHDGMDIRFSGDADTDFVRGMIPHHQGAIDMARIVLEFGKDPELRKLAAAIIRAQEEEIGWMQDWLRRNAPAK